MANFITLKTFFITSTTGSVPCSDGGAVLECHDRGLVRGEPPDVISIPICRDGLLGGSRYGSPSWLCLGDHRYVVYVFCIYLSIYVLICFSSDTDIVFVTLADVGEVGRLVARLAGHDPLR